MKWLVAKWRNCCRISYLFGHQLCVLILLVQSDFGMRELGLISMWLPLWGMRWKNRRQIHTSPSFIWMRKLGAILERQYANAGVVVRMHRNEFFRSLASMIRYAGANESREFMNKWRWCDRRSTQPVERQMSLGHRRLDVCVGEGSQPSATNSKHDHRSAVVKTQSQIVPVRIVRVGSKHYWLLRRTVLQQRGNFINNGLLYGRHLTTSLATAFHDAF